MTNVVLPLAELCDIVIGRTPPRAKPQFWAEAHPWLSIADMGKSRVITSTKERISEAGAELFRGRLVAPGTVLLSFKLSVGKVGIAGVPLYTNEAIAALPVRNKNQVLPEYLAWYLESADLLSGSDRAAMGNTLNLPKLQALSIPLPPLPEQRRIAAILDQADELRAKRRRALALLDDLGDSIFIEMFEVDGPWPMSRLSDLIAIPLRNGVSPSSVGAFAGAVLTLSAITRGFFDSTAKKTGQFDRPHDAVKMVREGELLICRGNGNRNLVGRGELAVAMEGDVAFPDTMISARPRVELIESTYLQATWNRRFVRAQIDSAARTTNGTFKVNQQGLEAIRVPMPHIELQRDYANRVAGVRAAAELESVHLAKLDELFASLQHRAFNGEL